MREIILADHAGFCFGVQRAVAKAFELSGKEKKIFTFGELIHNSDVVKQLENSQVRAISEEHFGSVTNEDTVLIRSHGVTKEKMDAIGAITDKVINLTCPYVTNIQRKVSEYYDKGYHIVILGDADHPEVIGINGWCENTALISKGGDVDFIIPAKICVVSQTTEKQANWEKLIANLARAKEMVAFNTICAATEQRQASTMKLSKEADAMVVIGGKNSSNTTKLFEICQANCRHTYFVENAEELKQYIEELKGYEKIGVTAGASTPDWIIKEAIELL